MLCPRHRLRAAPHVACGLVHPNGWVLECDGLPPVSWVTAVFAGGTHATAPALRFGNISTSPVAVKQPTQYREELNYRVDMHSRSGYSGSPVFVYRTPGNTLEWAVR